MNNNIISFLYKNGFAPLKCSGLKTNEHNKFIKSVDGIYCVVNLDDNWSDFINEIKPIYKAWCNQELK